MLAQKNKLIFLISCVFKILAYTILNNIIYITALLSSNRNVFADEIDSVKIVFYFGPTYSDHQSYYLNDVTSLLEHPSFTHNKTSCYLHGYMNTQEDYSVKLLVDSYLKGNTLNFLTVDFAALVNGSYISAQENVLKLAPRLADSILNLFGAGLDKNSLSLVGHSLGGILVGLVGRDIFKKSNGSVLLPRITSLDPSNPEAHDVFILPPVEKTDAKFVDVIHASAGKQGTARHTGHADFWPNGGSPIQPGCPAESVNKVCSHHKAWAYWAQSIAHVNSSQLRSYRAHSYEEFLASENSCKRGSIQMGIDCPERANGDYYLKLDSNYGDNGDPSGLPR